MPLEYTEGHCRRCNQPRKLFPYKPLHDCIPVIGSVGILEAADHIAWFEDNADDWCTRRVERRTEFYLICVPCHSSEAEAEQKFIDEVLS